MNWTVQNIRKSYIDFFIERQHRCVPSCPIVPPNDSDLLFISAGMVQFKSYYSGTVDVPFKRACSIQKCLRAGGKGSDLENVGRTIRHHTFFEMLGNFSFGDYFKQEAIKWALEFINEINLSLDKLYVTVFKEDDEAENIWTSLGFPKDRIFKLGVKDNFWGPVGGTGACGPSSEIIYDMGPEFNGSEDPYTGIKNGDERYLEFWNIVFPQFDQQKDGSRKTLKNKGIDTGLGLERLACILQEVDSPYYTNEIYPICDAACSFIGVNYNDSKDIILSINVIADHIRALVFTINENTLPSNEGRGYVLRRLLRRALRHAKKIGMEKPFLSELVDVVVCQMGDAYPELKRNPAFLKEVIKSEEFRFIKTLNKGVKTLSKIMNNIGEGGTIYGEEIFRLYDTHGFPQDMTKEIVEENNITFNNDSYQHHMNEQKKRSIKMGE